MRVPKARTLSICLGIGAVGVAAVAIPAWGKSGGDDDRGRFEQDLEEFRDCMSEQGVDLPEPPSHPRGEFAPPPGERGGFAIPAPPPHRGFRGRFERAHEPAGGEGAVVPAPFLSREDRESFRGAIEECGAPPFPRPPFAGRLRGEVHDCLAEAARQRRR